MIHFFIDKSGLYMIQYGLYIDQRGGVMDNNTWNWEKQEFENRAKEKLASMSQVEKETKAKKYKNFNVIVCSIFAALFFIGAIITILIVWVPSEEPVSVTLAVFVFLMYGIGIIAPLIGIYLVSKKPLDELALAQIKMDIRKSISKLSNKQIIGEMSKRDFIVSKSINIAAGGRSFAKLLIDSKHKLFIYQQGSFLSKTYRFSDLINYEVYENGQSKVKGRAGSALIGGAFFGITGLIVGSSMSRQIEDKCNQLKLIIRLNDLDCPQIVITYVDNATWEKAGFTYRSMKENLQLVCSALEYIMNAKTLEQSAIEKTEEQITKEEKSLKEQIQELKEMLDDGLITQEEFEQKKKQILELKN